MHDGRPGLGGKVEQRRDAAFSAQPIEGGRQQVRRELAQGSERLDGGLGDGRIEGSLRRRREFSALEPTPAPGQRPRELERRRAVEVLEQGLEPRVRAAKVDLVLAEPPLEAGADLGVRGLDEGAQPAGDRVGPCRSAGPLLDDLSGPAVELGPVGYGHEVVVGRSPVAVQPQVPAAPSPEREHQRLQLSGERSGLDERHRSSGAPRRVHPLDRASAQPEPAHQAPRPAREAWTEGDGPDLARGHRGHPPEHMKGMAIEGLELGRLEQIGADPDERAPPIPSLGDEVGHRSAPAGEDPARHRRRYRTVAVKQGAGFAPVGDVVPLLRADVGAVAEHPVASPPVFGAAVYEDAYGAHRSLPSTGNAVHRLPWAQIA